MIKKVKIRKDMWHLPIVFYVLLLQNPLELVHPVFGYIDELFGLFGITVLLIRAYRARKLTIKVSSAKMLLAFSVFMMSGLLGNFLYQYQPLRAVLIDIYTNMKFFLSVISGYVLFMLGDSQHEQERLAYHARMAALVFFAMLVVDQLFHVFDSLEMRYGLRAVQLIFYHPTYLAGACVFLLTVLTVAYQKQNNLYLIMCLAVLFFTLRGKAVVGAIIFCVIFYFLMINRKKLKIWHIVLMGLTAVIVAGEQIVYYYVDLEGRSARSVLTQTSFRILKDYFPIGTGFGTYASASAAIYYSPVYVKYGFLSVYELGGGGKENGFFADTFWPIIIGQTGLIGTIAYVSLLIMLFLRVLKIRKVSIPAYTAGIFIFAYLMVSSTSEPAFNNATAVPLAMMLGYILSLEKRVNKSSREGSCDILPGAGNSETSTARHL